MQRDYAQEITDRILADMASGVMPYEKQWDGKHSVNRLPLNATSGKNYRGINILLLWGACYRHNWEDMRFLTFKQALDAGGAVRKGEKGTGIYFYKPLTVKDKETDEDKQIPMLRLFTVFNVSQVDGCENLKTGNADAPIMPEDTREFVNSLRMSVIHGGDSAMYMPKPDRIAMPFPQDFNTPDDYRRTLYHETCHWTGAKHRLNRDFSGRFRDEAYAREELVAEFGAAFICAEFGVSYTSRHPNYIDNWAAVLKRDKRAILQAASAAQKAVDFIRTEIAGSAGNGLDEMAMAA